MGSLSSVMRQAADEGASRIEAARARRNRLLSSGIGVGRATTRKGPHARVGAVVAKGGDGVCFGVVGWTRGETMAQREALES